MPSNRVRVGLHLRVNPTRKPTKDFDREPIDPNTEKYFFMNLLVGVIAVVLTTTSHIFWICVLRRSGFDEILFIIFSALTSGSIFYPGAVYLRVLVLEKVIIGVSILLASIAGWVVAPFFAQISLAGFIIGSISWFGFWDLLIVVFVLTPGLAKGRDLLGSLQELKDNFVK